MSSITGLFNQLLDAHINRELLRPQLDPLSTTLHRHRKALRAALYRTLFARLRGPLQRDEKIGASAESWDGIAGQRVTCGTKERLLQVVFEMRRQRKYDEAHKLEGLVSSLPDVDNGRHTEMKAAIQLLLVLAGTGQNRHEKPHFGHREPDLPLVSAKNKDDRAVMLSTGPRYHGDSCHVYHQGYQGYIHYSRDLFEGQQLQSVHQLGDQAEDVNYRMLHSKLFEAEPGRDLLGKGLFSLRGLLDSKHEQTTRETLFSGLTHSKTRQLNVRLDLPELPDTNNTDLLGLHIPTLSEPSEDEGFHESSSLSTPSTETSVTRDENVWQMALEYRPNRHYTWETLGNIPRTTERPYLTEAGSKVFDAMYRRRCQEASVLDASLQRPLVVFPDQVQPVRDSIHVLLSVPSVVFRLDEEAQCFVVNPDVCLTGTTPGSCNQLLAELAQAGTDHHRLTTFAQQRVLDSTYTGGLVLQAFMSGIRRFLQYYQAVVLRASSSGGKLTVMTLLAMFGKMIQQLRYLADLCDCNQCPTTKPGDPGDAFPLGIKLLSYLYQKALDCSLQDRYQLVLSLLRSSCGPYLMFIQDWVFHGICRDVFGEFLISVSDEYLHYRDKHYWTQGFVLKSDNAEESVPLFLKDLAYDIYICGKSLNLIRLCCPEHFLCNPGVTTPRISLTFSAEELDNSARRTRVYIGHMQALARQKTISRREKAILESEAKQSLISQTRKAASDVLKKLQDALQEQRAAEDAKKRQEFQLLKDQMQSDLVRRALAEDLEKQEDVERMDALTKKEHGQAKAQYELEQEVREEVIEYYAQLSEEAAARERKALWRVHRHRLDQARLEFVLREESRIQQELAEKQSITTPVSRSEDTSKETEGSEITERLKGMEVGPAGVIQREAVMGQDKESRESTALSVDRTDGSDAIQLSASAKHGAQAEMLPQQMAPRQVDPERASRVQPRPPRQADAQPEETSPSLLISVGSDMLGTGELPNEDIEATLQMISQAGSGGRRTKMPQPNLMDLSIGDFLPKEHVEDDGLEMASPNDANVDDVLIQIGSSLPSEVPKEEISSQQPPTLDVIHDMLGLSKLVDSSSTDPELPSLSQAHPSDSAVGGILYSPHTTVEQSIPAFFSTRGQPADSCFRVGQESSGDEMKPVVKSVFGHAGDFSLGDFLYPREETPRVGVRSNDPGGSSPEEISQPQTTVTAYPHPSDSTISLIPVTSVELSIPSALATYGKPSNSYFKEGHQNQSGGEGKAKPRSSHGHAGDSTLGDVLYPVAARQRHSEVSDKVNEPHFAIADSNNRSEGTKQDTRPRVTEAQSKDGGVIFKPPLAHATDSTIQSMLYPDDGPAGVHRQPENRTRIVAAPHGHHPSDSTAQNVMYGRGAVGVQKGGETESRTGDDTDAGDSKTEQSVILWSGQGVEPFQDNFDTLDKAPMPDLLSNIGFTPLSTEIGDYGLQAAESESIEAVELQSLPIIMKRSVTSPLLAQISLVNQSILAYFMVELGIGKHFEAIRRFLFLEDGEFGHSLCDQLFDKLAQGLRPHELLTPVVLNQLLARAVQNSASSESEFANNLGFSLKYLPHHFKPNAIDTFDCLELRYRVDWPHNIVITDTCLAKYNRVFSFLLQLKRISWVLRDIYFQLKRSAMVSHAGSCPQFRQLQLFRHEMQHFVNVMQGYVVNQVIHVTWEEFQRQLKTEVHNLDDLHQKHAEYLNKAIFRCLLNKKAAPVMKIISDILRLILKVRTQLVSSSWVYDEQAKQAAHPGFHTIKLSYLAFKDYSEFLYKVVAKLVTRGYQPHLEEFMLRLNFNDFYQES